MCQLRISFFLKTIISSFTISLSQDFVWSTVEMSYLWSLMLGVSTEKTEGDSTAEARVIRALSWYPMGQIEC